MVNFEGKSEENPKSKAPTQDCPTRTKLKAIALCSVRPWELRRKSHKADKEVKAERQGTALPLPPWDSRDTLRAV